MEPHLNHEITPYDIQPPHMLHVAIAIQKWPYPSFTARDWAKAFVDAAAKRGHPGIDEDWARVWFGNALMRGFDEANARRGRRQGDD